MGAWDLGSTGTDAAGAVTVVVGADGMAESIRVHPNWRGLVGSAGFAAAVTEAGRAAVHAQPDPPAAHTRPWDGLDDPRNRSSLRPQSSPARRVAFPASSARAEDIWLAVHAAERLVNCFESSVDVGHARLGRLTLRLDASGAVVCEADAEWVGQQGTDGLASALASALASLRATRDETEAAWDAAVAAVARLGHPAPSREDG
ncbi:MAG TPA: hypothetical protein VH561_12965 [Micromonosporaceae bacterium]